LIPGVELVRKLRLGGNAFQELGRPKVEIDLKSVLVLRDISRSLEPAVQSQRVAIHRQYASKRFEPRSVGKECLNIAQREDDVVVGERVGMGVRNRARAGEDHRPHQRLLLAPVDQLLDNLLLFLLLLR
jgi:hypothetical protein